MIAYHISSNLYLSNFLPSIPRIYTKRTNTAMKQKYNTLFLTNKLKSTSRKNSSLVKIRWLQIYDYFYHLNSKIVFARIHTRARVALMLACNLQIFENPTSAHVICTRTLFATYFQAIVAIVHKAACQNY